MSEAVANKLITFGGMLVAGDGSARLDQWGLQRANRVAKHYFDNRKRFEEPDAWILCSGGWPRFGRGMSAPPDDAREGLLAARHLFGQGVPSKLLHTATNSYSTVTNLTEAQRDGYLDPEDFDVEDPLGFVSNPNHLRRCIKVVKKLGIDEAVIQPLPTDEADSRLRELIVGGVYSAGLAFASGAASLERREERFILPVFNLIQKFTGAGGGLAPAA